MKAITDLFEDAVSKYSSNVLLWEKKIDKYEPLTYSEVKEKVYQFAAGLISLGVKKGDRIALLSEGRNDWAICEMGILYAGAVNVPLSVKLSDPSELDFRLNHSSSKMIIVSKFQEKKVKSLKQTVPSLEKIIYLDDIQYYDEKEISLNDVFKLGKEFLINCYPIFEDTWRSVKPCDFANICYTSGTTADPKGIILTHRNYTANVEQALSLMNIHPHYVSLLILPWDHAFAHTCGIFVLMASGASMASVHSGKNPMDALKNIPINIKEIRPHFLMSVPALAKNFRKNIENGIRSKGPLANWLFNAGLNTAYLYNGIGWNKGKGFRMFLWPLVKLFDVILFKKIREAFGGRLKYFIGGGALLDIELQRFFYAIGIPMYQGYGLTEASPVISSNSEIKHKLGSSGYLVKPMNLKICDNAGEELPVGEKGEIVINGENVMAGYWNNPVATVETIKNGWLYTGDMGAMDKDGFLYVYGRFKSLLIADDGEKYCPEGIEEAIVSQSQYIEQCLLFNNQKPYTVALLYPNWEAVKRWLKREQVAADTKEGHEAVLRLLESEINEYRTGHKHEKMFPQRWLPSAIAILQEGFTEQNHLLNSSLKMVRPKIIIQYTDILKFLYTPEAKDICNCSNMVVINEMLKDKDN
jgi:long-chain acyl-CoA synthetase